MTFTWNAVVDGEDIADIVLAGASVSYGRATLFDQPAPPTATLQLVTKDYAPDLAANWPEFSLGDHSQTSASLAGKFTYSISGLLLTVSSNTKSSTV